MEMDELYTFAAEGRQVAIPGIVTEPLPPLGPGAHDLLAGRTQTFGRDSCFICGRHIPDGHPERTREDVFPKWLMKVAGLTRAEVSSLNGRFHRYSSVLIPCCKICNNEDWSRIENRVRRAFLEGAEAVRVLSDDDLILWATKIYYGLFYRESLLAADITSPASVPLIPENHLRSLGHLHLNLQVASGRATWAHPPASVFVFECQTAAPGDLDSQLNFDFFDDTEIPMLGIRLGETGVIVMLADWGRLAWYSQRPRSGHCWNVFEAATSDPLHPTQFRELQPVLKHLSLATDQWNMYTMAIAPSAEEPVLLMPKMEKVVEQPVPFNVDRFAFDLAAAWGVSTPDVRHGDSVLSSIHDASAQDGRIRWQIVDGPFVGLNGNHLWPWVGGEQTHTPK